ncbi:hypothetical protein [Paenibacillus polysaccharolyticus]|uniref:hypothetical protein n=1 Tax=Paenibacillus polysaccharolyticus TaxID=582692 RepID=UPI00300B60A4
MKKNSFLKMLSVAVMSTGLAFGSVASAFAAENVEIPDTSIIGSESYVAPVPGANNDGFSTFSTISTHSWLKSYKNLYGITVATQEAFAQWTWDDGKITNFGNLWQNNSTAPLYGFKDEENKWNYKYTSSGQTNQGVLFESGIPTPWGHAGGSEFTSRILINVSSSGSSTAQ